MRAAIYEQFGQPLRVQTVDDPVPPEIIQELSKIRGVENLRFVNLGEA